MIDAVVVGAGLSGLVCARRLGEAGARVLVVEARDRVGGRLWTGSVGGQTVDLGGQWLTATQDRLVALAAELGVPTFQHDRSGRAQFPPGGLVTAFAQWRAIRRIKRAIARLPAADPAALDRESLADYFARSVRNPIARARLALHAEAVFAADPADLSLLAYLDRLRTTGGFAPEGPDLPGGGREHRFDGGAQRLAIALAASLDVRLGEPIDEITDTGTHVTARGPRGEHVARHLVLALPPVLVRAIRVELAEPARRFVDSIRVGSVVKVFAAYARPFWRDAGWSGEAYVPAGTVRVTVPIGNTLCAFVVGREAARWAARDLAERRADVIATFASQFGEAAREPLDYLEVDWGADRWSGGCVAAMPPGVLSRGAAWSASHGRIHLAGTETSPIWPGYMDGAVVAGERAASTVLAAL